MVLSRTVLAACLAVSQVFAMEFGVREEPIAHDAQLWAPALSHEKNASQVQPLLMERNLQLEARQSCDAGYWYCTAFGKCCPTTTLCCSYGYCITPGDTCCPNGSCDSGYGCCQNKCAPLDSQCCLDGNYCEKGNVCVKLYSTGEIVCCTDTKCTAAVISGTTSYASRTVAAPSFTPPPSITIPDVPTTSSSSTEDSTVTRVDVVETWYWTVTWWYYSFWYTSFRATSTVTYTRVYETTTFTTTATDEAQARSRFSALSATLTFEPPASAHTELASLLTDTPSETPNLVDQTTLGSGPPSTTSRRSTTSRATSSASASATALSGGGGAAASGLFVQWGMVVMAGVAGTLMIVL